MKDRPNGFLGEENISHTSEVFDYIVELHAYLWGFVNAVKPNSSGSLRDILDTRLAELQARGLGDRRKNGERRRGQP